ncbi:MAG: Orotate phosphoribosyltransferase [Pseudomonadota bacterium]|jgi:orotate phosphoribosyltransferase
METYKTQFIDFMLRAGVLTFGDFVTKSGRKTPYFVNTGLYSTGSQLNRLAEFYVDAIDASGIQYDFLFGPAYKGIPLVVVCAVELSRRGRDVPFAFNRKEAKDHGEGGLLVGHKPKDGQRVLILEDVTTAGTSIRETVPLLRAAADVQLAGLVVSVDRMERAGAGPFPERAALAAVGAEFDMETVSIVNVEEIIEALRERATRADTTEPVLLDDEHYARMRAYLTEYGALTH